MVQANDVHGAVFERASVVLMSRIIGADGEPLQVADTLALNYTVYEVDRCGFATADPVPGHDQVVLSPASVLSDTLQTDPMWSVDTIGYNFRHEVDISQAEAFPTAGRTYQVRYELQPLTGQKVVFRFLLRAI